MARLASRVDTLWKNVVDTSNTLIPPEERRLARLLTSFIVILLLFGLLYNVLLLRFDSSYFSTTLPFAAPALSLLIIGYGLSRTSHYRWAALMVITAISGGALIAAVLNPDYRAYVSAAFTLSLVLAGIFFSPRQMLIIAAANGIGLLLSFFLSYRSTSIGEAAATTLLLGVTLGTILFWQRYRDDAEHDRQAALLASEQRFRLIVETAPEAILLTDPAGKIVLVNEHVERMFGYLRDELLGQPVERLLPENVRANHEHDRRRFFEHPSTRPMGTNRTLTGLRKNGTAFPIEVGLTYTHTRDEVLALAFVADVSDRAETAKSLREHQEMLQTISDLSPVGISLLDSRRKMLYANPALGKILGFSLDDLYAGKHRDRHYFRSDGTPFLPDQLPSARVQCEGSIVHDVEIGIQQEDGQIIWTNVSAAPTPDGNVVVVTTDITELKRKEAALQHQALVLANVSDAVMSLDTNGCIVSWNTAAEEIFGWRADEAIGMDIGEFLKTEYPPLLDRSSVVAQLLKEGFWRGELGQRHKDGRPLRIQTSTRVLKDGTGAPIGSVTVNRDVTSERELAESLHRQNTFLTILHEITLDLLNHRTISDLLQSIVDHAATIMDAPYAELMFIEGDELVVQTSTSNYALVAGDRVKRHEATLTWKAYDTKTIVTVEDYSVFPNRRTIFDPLSLTAIACIPIMVGEDCLGVLDLCRSIPNSPFTPEQIEQGVLFSQLIALLLDNTQLYEAAQREITRRSEAEEAARKANELFSKVFHSSPAAISISTLDQGYHVDVNDAFLKVFGFAKKEEVVGRTSAELNTWADITQRQIIVDRLREDSSSEPFEYKFRTQSGEIRDALTTADIIEFDGKAHILAMFYDVTLRKRAEAQQLELKLANEKTALLKEFLNMLSHDLKTPLSIINTSIYLLQKISDPVKQQEKLENIKLQALHVENILQDILTVSRLDSIPKMLFTPVDVNRVIHHLQEALQPLAEAKHLTLQIHPATEAVTVPGDETELIRALSNLVENSIHYTQAGGTITIRTERRNNCVVVTVSDTGIGISAADLPYIFDHFYRADKARSVDQGGTGLGLAIVKKIVEIHGGYIDVESALGQGSTFCVSLPFKGGG